MKLYQRFAQVVEALNNCQKTGNAEWIAKHKATLDELIKLMPSGSGVDSGSTFDFNKSTAEKLVFQVDYHHMDENGFYDGWTTHEVSVTPSLAHDFNLKITGPNKNDVKDYLGDLYCETLKLKV
jgi:hypothetical protein